MALRLEAVTLEVADADAAGAFWAGLLALAWFSHGVMVSWSRPEDRQLANIEIVLSLVVVLAASLPGLRARFSKR